MRHPRLVLAARAHPTVGNEAGMCPGINRFTKCAPIADWVRRGVPLWCSRVGSGGAPVVGPGTTALRVRHEKRKFAKRTWNVSWNQQINFLVRSTDPVAEARTHRKRARCNARHPRLVWAARAHPTVWNEAGICPGINRFTKVRAPIADWVRGSTFMVLPCRFPAALP